MKIDLGALLINPNLCPLGAALALNQCTPFHPYPSPTHAAEVLGWPIDLCLYMVRAFDNASGYPEQFDAGTRAGMEWLETYG